MTATLMTGLLMLVLVAAVSGGVGLVHGFKRTLLRMWDGEEARERVKRSRLFWW